MQTDRHGGMPPLRADAAPESVLPPERGGLLPQYSFRTVVILMTAVVFAAFAFRQAWLGEVWAQAFAVISGFLVACFTLYAILYLIAWIPARLGRDDDWEVMHGNPFADGQLPPQLLPPSDPKS